MHQTAFHYPEHAGYKAEGTSQDAAAAIEGSGQAARLRTAVLGWYGRQDGTPDECAASLGESILSIRPRCSELCKQGRLHPTGIRRPSSTGKSQNVLAMTPANQRIAA
jgi:hypothetical protein